MARYSVWTKVTLDFELPVEAESFDKAAILAEKWERQAARIVKLIQSKNTGFNEIKTKVYGVFEDD